MRRNWEYQYFPNHAHPHAITFNRCRDSGVHEYKFTERVNVTSWHLDDATVSWLEANVGLDHCTYDVLVPYAVNFLHKQDAMLFKLTLGN